MYNNCLLQKAEMLSLKIVTRIRWETAFKKCTYLKTCRLVISLAIKNADVTAVKWGIAVYSEFLNCKDVISKRLLWSIQWILAVPKNIPKRSNEKFHVWDKIEINFSNVYTKPTRVR